MEGERWMRKIERALYMVFITIILLDIFPYGAYAADTIDKEKPVLEYAYVQNGMLRLVISDNEELDDRPIYFKFDKELRYYYIDIDDYEYERDGRTRKDRYYEIEVEIPSKITIILKDKAGNESTYNLSIKEDNVAVTKQIPIFITERLMELRQSRVNRFEGFDNIFEMEYGKVINAISIYDDTIRNSYRSYNKNDIRFKVSGLSIDKEGNIKLDKYGIFKVTMTHNKDKTFEETAYILIKPDWRNTEKRKVPVNASPYIVYSDKIKLADYFRYEDENTGGKSKIDTSYMLVYNEDTGKIVTMNDQIALELNKIYNLSVLNFEDNSQQDFYIMRQEKLKAKNRDFIDVDKEHWASKDISSLVSKGLISGYPDGTFNPSGNITVKEFMAILSRKIAENPAKGRPIAGDVKPAVGFDSWGYIESKSILDRISDFGLYRFNYVNLDRPIKREEVAFLIDSTLELGTGYNNPNLNSQLSDVDASPYRGEIVKLVDLGIISGYPNGTFRPYNHITRAEVAALFARLK